MDIRGTNQYLQLTTRDWVHPVFRNTWNEYACMFGSSYLFIGISLTVIFFYHICNIKHRLSCKYSSHNIFYAKDFNPHKRPSPLLNMDTCSQSMQRTWWSATRTTIVTGSYCAGVGKFLISPTKTIFAHWFVEVHDIEITKTSNFWGTNNSTNICSGWIWFIVYSELSITSTKVNQWTGELEHVYLE